MASEIARRSVLHGFIQPAASGPDPGIVFHERHPVTMLNLRGPAEQAFFSRAQDALGCALPSTPNSSRETGEGDILRLGPNEWLLVAGARSRWSEAISIAEATLTDVGHARAVILARGERVRDALSKGCPVDLHPGQFPAGTCIQTSMARINVILHRRHNGDEYALYVPRSYAGSFWHWLAESATEYGYQFIRQ